MKKTMFEKYGGFATFRKVVSSFYDNILDSSILQKHFININIERLIDHQTKFVIFIAGGPGSVSDENLARVHKNMGITQEEMDEMSAIFRDNLEDHDFEDDDVEFLVNEVVKRSHLIVQ